MSAYDEPWYEERSDECDRRWGEPDEEPCIGAECTLPDPHHAASECVTVADIEAWHAFERLQRRREQWPRLYALLDWIACHWRRVRSRYHRAAPQGESADDEIPF